MKRCVTWKPRKVTLLLAAFAACVFISVPATPVDAQTRCVWRGTAPFCKGKCRPGELFIERTSRSLYGVAGTPVGYSGQACVSGSKALCCTPCPSGLVWRERVKYDFVCVTPAQRAKAQGRR